MAGERVTKLVIDRSRWYRGQGHEGSSLLRRDADMCCLGFYGIALGARPADIRDRGAPSEAPAFFPTWLLNDSVSGNSAECGDLMAINDDDLVADPEREARITEIFARHGVDVEFVDGPVKP